MKFDIQMDTQQLVIGFTGFAGSGKDTAADYLVNEYGFTKLSFADAVKDVLSIVFGWERDMLEGKSKISREWREEVDEMWATALGISDFTPRKAMQLVGTDLFRKHISEDIWVLSMIKQIMGIIDKGGNVVLADCRFRNEIEMITHLFQGDVIEVQRGENPDWYITAREANRGDQGSIDIMEASDVHPSEWKWIGVAASGHKHVTNDSGLEDLYKRVFSCVPEVKRGRK